MSLHHLANRLQSAGRGEDKVLVHMTPKEVQGLQTLAMKHGGSLTINPHTGLPEASFLSSILPMIAGFALAPLTAGTSLAFLGASPLAAAMTVGGITGLAKGSLKEGLMAGLGAYGGAGMQAGLAASAAGTGLSASGAPLNSVMGASAAPAATTAATTATPALNGSMMAGASPSTIGHGFFNTAPNIAAPITSAAAPALTPVGTMAQPSLWNQTVAGSKAAFGGGTEGLKTLYGNLPTGTLPAIGATLASGMQKDFNPPKTDKGTIRPYEFTRTQNQEAYDQGNPIYAENPGSSRERNYFNDQYTALPTYAAASGGLMDLNAFAVGGPVEEMSAQNAIGNNQMYPQSQLQSSMYGNPMVQRPMPNNIVSGGGDAPVDPYTGEPRFASGGATPETTGEYKYNYNPQTQQFTQTSAPKPVATGRGLNLGLAGGNFGNAVFDQQQRLNRNAINGTPYHEPLNQQAAPAAPVVTGGIAPPVGQAQPQQAYQQPPIPAYQSPEQQLGLDGFYDYMNQELGGMRDQGYANGGGVGSGYNLGGYSDGGRLLKGPGDGVSDSIPAVIGNRQPARLADGEFVVPARIVSELGNGSTEAGAKRLYAMMDRVQHARRKSIGKGNVAVNSKADKHLPA